MWNGAPGSSTLVGALEHVRERVDVREGAVAVACRCAKSITGRIQPVRAEIAKTSSAVPSSRTRPITSTPNGTSAVLLLEPLAQLAELRDDVVERVVALAAEQEARVEDDDLGAAGLAMPGGVVEHPERHVELLAALDVADEAGERRVHGERDSGLARELAEALGPGVVHPEAALEVDLAGRVAALAAGARSPPLGCPARARARGRSGFAHGADASAGTTCPSRRSDAVRPFVPWHMASPARIDLLELDIDLRLTDLWREACEITEWNLEVVGAFMRAAYGKGYCDALTEDRRARSARSTATGSRAAGPRRPRD